mmetsp:Transcript_30133/g.63534  ORF Transcript_30133/g.63534 Transcript_30133/m.63534 type:complete len:114 (-) Transcript_30133:1838-2179(-)
MSAVPSDEIAPSVEPPCDCKKRKLSANVVTSRITIEGSAGRPISSASSGGGGASACKTIRLAVSAGRHDRNVAMEWVDKREATTSARSSSSSSSSFKKSSLRSNGVSTTKSQS